MSNAKPYDLTEEECLAIGEYWEEEHKRNNPRPTRIVQVQVKHQYGVKRFYPANEEAFSFLRIQGGKTLTQDTLGDIRDLGFDINFLHEEVVL